MKKIAPAHRQVRSRAFTLVEILIAVAVFALLFWLFNEFMMHGRRQTENLLEKGDNLRNTRLALQDLEKDVRESCDIIDYVNDADVISMILKHVKKVENDETINYNYVTYTYYKTQQNVGGKTYQPLSFVRGISDAEPAAGTKASGKVLLSGTANNLTKNRIGVLSDYEFAVAGAGTVKKETKFQILNTKYDAAVMLDIALDQAKKDEMLAKATYKGEYNGAVVGFSDIKSAVAVMLQFIVADNNQNVNYFNEIVYMRTKL